MRPRAAMRAVWSRHRFAAGARLGDAFERFTRWTDTWLSIEHAVGPEATGAVYRMVLVGLVAPDVAHTLAA